MFILSSDILPSTLVPQSTDDNHDYETQEDWDDDPETPPQEFYSHYPAGDKVGSSDEDEDEEEEPHYEPVR